MTITKAAYQSSVARSTAFRWRLLALLQHVKASHVALDNAYLAAVLQPVLAADVVLCTDGFPALAAAALCLGVQHHAINASACQHALGARNINNFNGYYCRLKGGLRRFNGVASSCPHPCLGWFRALERFRPVALTPSALWALAIGI